MKAGDTVRHDNLYGIAEVVQAFWHPIIEKDIAVVRAQNELCYLALQSELELVEVEMEIESIRWQEAGF